MADEDFAEWALTYSQRTNRSLAGSRLRPEREQPASAFRNAAVQWGVTVSADADDDDGVDAGADVGAEGTASIALDMRDVQDARTLSGKDAIDYAERHMPVMRTLMAELRSGTDFNGLRIAVCLVLEPKTAVLLRQLKAAGAMVGVFADPSETDQRVADQLRREGITVEADARWTAEQAQAGALRLLDTIAPHIIIDDGASFARLAAAKRPDLLDGLIGVAEETTSGVRAFQAMQDAGALTFPVVAVNDSVLKTGFDNAHGTGETCVTTMQQLLGAHCFRDASVTVIGYGPVGRGFALRVRALGANVTICDTDPVAALKAVFDGFDARDIDEAVVDADIVVSATGVRHTITVEHMRLMRERAVLSVIGGIANEIALDDIPGFHHDNTQPVGAIAVPDGPTLTLLAQGDGVNYTAGGGNPIEIMDLSFAVQVSAVHHLLAHRSGQHRLPPQVHRLSAASDRHIAAIALRTRGLSASHATADNGYDWRLTRFDDTV